MKSAVAEQESHSSLLSKQMLREAPRLCFSLIGECCRNLGPGNLLESNGIWVSLRVLMGFVQSKREIGSLAIPSLDSSTKDEPRAS